MHQHPCSLMAEAIPPVACYQDRMLQLIRTDMHNLRSRYITGVGYDCMGLQ